MLRHWWVKKYQIPPTADEYLRYTPEELWVEFFEDYYRANPVESTAVGEENGEDVQFETGDPVIDEMERKMAAGEMTEEEMVKEIDSWGKPSEAPPAIVDEVELPEFEDAYGHGSL